MTPFKVLTGVAVAYNVPDIDTDKLIPHRFLRKPLSDGYGNFLFHDERFTANGDRDLSFPLNDPAYRDASILVSGKNFGCGSTREGAVYALADYGIRAVLAPSFADIFAGNCFQNGILTVELPESVVEELCAAINSAPGMKVTVDLAKEEVRLPNSKIVGFQIEEPKKKRLLEGLDDIGVTLKHSQKIDSFEQSYGVRFPWLQA